MTGHLKDARVRRTQRRLHEAIVSLIHEKSYPAIAVRDILERAEVGRSAFYAHFPNKDALLASGIEHVLHATAARTPPPSVGRFGNALRFSAAVFEHIGDRRSAAGSHMHGSGRHVVHEHLRRVLVAHVRDELRQAPQRPEGHASIPVDLATDYVVTTFLLVLNWWVESRSRLSAHEVNDVFLALVMRGMTSIFENSEEP